MKDKSRPPGPRHSWTDVLREDVSDSAQRRILDGAENALAGNRRDSKRTIFWWLGGLATAGVAFLLLPGPKRSMTFEADRALVMDLEEEGEEVAESIADLDLIEELELISDWNGEV